MAHQVNLRAALKRSSFSSFEKLAAHLGCSATSLYVANRERRLPKQRALANAVCAALNLKVAK